MIRIRSPWPTVVLHRLGGMVLVMLAVSFLLYGVLEIDASAIATKILGQFSTPEQRAIWLHRNGYDRPFLWRYAQWLGRFVTGDWGRSLHDHVAVRALVPHRLGASLALCAITMAVTVPLGLGVGIVSGLYAGRWLDTVLSAAAIMATAIPDYASCAFLSAIFVVGLHWLPGASTMTDGFDPRQMALPASVLILYCAGYLARVTGAAIRAEMGRPYVRTAWLKGAGRGRLVLRHILPNALAAPVTVIMQQVPWLLSGMLVVEIFFGYRGFGSLLYTAAMNGDLPVVEACTMLSVACVTCAQFVSDLLTTLLDPRARGVFAPRPAAPPQDAPAAATGRTVP
ncbi:ABC transporter permease [Gluconacetobacter azotocaptans]|nr:ABC transporter permease [Gluconacetobacter azotocaptans]